MKKKLTGCLIGCLLVLLFMTTPAFAHIKADGTKCQSEGYNSLAGSENKTETQHRMQCKTCYEIMWENHWRKAGDKPTCKKQVYCGLCGIKFGPFGEHKFSEATCVAKATCTVCKLQTGEIDPNNHDLKHSAAKAPTCTKSGWNEYDECQREGCEYTTKVELPASGHKTVKHDAKPATCTEAGWNAYETCENCDHTTYAEIPATDHNYVEQIIEPTCTKDGCTLHTCTNCNDSYTTNPTKKLYHWFAEWSPNEDDTHGAHCRRKGCKYVAKVDCQKFEFPVDEESLIFCPVCGAVENGERLERIAKATAKIVTGKRPKGELIVRTNGAFLSVAYEYAGKISEAAAQITITLPADALNGMKPVLVSLDGTETVLPFEAAGDKITFTLDFAEPEIPVFLIRLVPEA